MTDRCCAYEDNKQCRATTKLESVVISTKTNGPIGAGWTFLVPVGDVVVRLCPRHLWKREKTS